MPPDYATIIDAETWAFIERTGSFYPPDAVDLTIAEQRLVYDRMCAAFHAGRPEGLRVSDRLIGALPLRDYSTGGGAARVLYFHGGGFVVGGLDSHDDVCAELCARTGFDVTAVDYRLAPEHVFPADIEDAVTAWRDMVSRGEGPVVLAGDSAGGALCAGLCEALRGEDRQPAGQVLIYPGLGLDLDTDSMQTHAEAPMLTRADCRFYRGIRVGGDMAKLDDPRCSPMRAGGFEGLPPTFVVTAECDPLADDGRHYVEAIAAAGGRAELVCEAGLVHGYLRARHSVGRARASFTRIVTAIAALGAGRWPVDHDGSASGGR